MSKILRLESMLSGEHGGVIGEAIRACNRRLDNHRVTMDDFYARISTQDWYRDLSDREDDEEVRLSATRAENRDANAENQSGVESRPPGKLEVKRHNADFRGQCLGHHHHQYKVQMNPQH